MKPITKESLHPNRVTRDLIQNCYALKNYGIEVESRREHSGRKIIIKYTPERDGSDGKITAAVTVTENSQTS